MPQQLLGRFLRIQIPENQSLRMFWETITVNVSDGNVSGMSVDDVADVQDLSDDGADSGNDIAPLLGRERQRGVDVFRHTLPRAILCILKLCIF